MKFIFSFFFLLFFINLNSREGRYHNNEQDRNHKNVYVSEVLYNGAFIVLSDNSTWYIKPGNDQNIVYGWISPGKIQVKSNNNTGYSYLLYNTLTQDGVQAKKISRKEINEIDPAFLLIILSNKKYKFCNKIYNLLIKEINKSKLENTEKELMKKFIFLDE